VDCEPARRRVRLDLELHHVQHPDLETTAGMTPEREPRVEPPPAIAVAEGAQRTAFYKEPLVLFVFLATFALYLVSMPKTLALEDDSIFVLAGYFNGISHPPGYPLYTLLLKIFTLLPVGDIPARAHASSAFFAALACGSLFLIFVLLGIQRYVAALGAIVFSVTATFWSQAIITEVYSLNVFLNLCLFLFALKIFRGFSQASSSLQATQTNFILFSIFAGLALSNHWPLTLLAMPAYLLMIARSFFALKNKLFVVMPAVAIIAATYLYLYFNNQSSPFINFSGKFNGFTEWLEYIMRAHYAAVDFKQTAGWQDKWLFSRDLLIQIGRELNVLLLLSGLGAYRILKSADMRIVGLALLWVVLANSLLLIFLVDFDYGYLYAAVFRVYTIVSISMLFVLAGFGMAGAGAGSTPRISDYQLVIVLLLGLGLNAYFSLPQNYRHQYSWGEEYAQKILSEIPADAVLFSDGEVELGLLSYYRFIKKQRPDIELYSSSGLLLNNRLFDYRLEDKKAFIENYVAENQSQQILAANNLYGVSIVSATAFTEKLGQPDGESQHTINSNDIDLILKWSTEDYSHDPWTRIAVGILRQKAIAILIPTLKTTGDASLQNYISNSVSKLIQNEADFLFFLKAMIKGEAEIDTSYYQTQLDAIARSELLSKQDDSHYVYLAERIRQARQSADLIEGASRLACQNWPSRNNSYCRTEADG
jgi:hypothetical protein